MIKKGRMILDYNQIEIIDIEILIGSGISAFGSDSIHEMVYYFDKNKQQIIAINVTNPEMFAVVIENTKEFVADIKIDPLKNFVFWSQWDINDENVGIMRSNQDGTDTTIILAMIPSSRTSLLEMIPLKKPSFLAIDFRNEKLYFIDKRLYLLGSLDYFGNYKPVIPYDEENYDLLRKIFGYADSLDIYRDTILWSSLDYVYSIPENGDLHNLKKVLSAEHFVNCLTVSDHSRQPYGPNNCVNNNCCGLCLPTRESFKCALNHTTNNNSSCDVSFQTNKKYKKKF
jgi:hypothetical protein